MTCYTSPLMKSQAYPHRSQPSQVASRSRQVCGLEQPRKLQVFQQRGRARIDIAKLRVYQQVPILSVSNPLPLHLGLCYRNSEEKHTISMWPPVLISSGSQEAFPEWSELTASPPSWESIVGANDLLAHLWLSVGVLSGCMWVCV